MPVFYQIFLNQFPNIRLIPLTQSFVDYPKYEDHRQKNPNLLKILEHDIESIKGFMSSILRSYRSLAQRNFQIISPYCTTELKIFPVLHLYYFLIRKLIYRPGNGLSFSKVCFELAHCVEMYDLSNLNFEKMYECMIHYISSNIIKFPSYKQGIKIVVNEKDHIFMDLDIDYDRILEIPSS